MGCFSMCRLALLLLAVALDASALDASARLGFYGLGTMGTHMAGHLHGLAASSGGRAAVASRDGAKAEAWAAARGADVRAPSPSSRRPATSSACGARAAKYGVDAATALDVINSSSGASLPTRRLPERALSRDFGFGFKMGLMREDCAIADALVADLAPTHALIPEATRLIRGGGAAGERRGLRGRRAAPRGALRRGAALKDGSIRMLAASRVQARVGAIVATSHLYDTAPQHVVDQPRFLNGVVVAATALPPRAVLRELKAVEAALGREDRGRHGPRGRPRRAVPRTTMVADADLEVPHPRAARRDFVLRPLRDARRALDAFGVPYDARDVALVDNVLSEPWLADATLRRVWAPSTPKTRGPGATARASWAS
ncbi:2-amino-4-hydroxy-6-hydroxymethyldihydropteridine diphosphokinase [Aureococcus anophagefferens]|nr:2-amino-4-hydroxy-6-hydroxymethyldihydropteridine diphosphokinase [Aureococcus anophagefferens]